MRVTFFGCKKVTKNALYRRQLFEVLVGSAPGFGVWHRALFSDLRPEPDATHLTTIPIKPLRNPPAPVKSAFAYFSGACEKQVACKREARGEMQLKLKLKWK